MTALALALACGLTALVAAGFSADSAALVAFGGFLGSALTYIIPAAIDRAKRKALGGQ